jgi:hypothetical protein
LVAIGVNQADLASAYAVVYPMVVQISCSGYSVFSFLWPRTWPDTGDVEAVSDFGKVLNWPIRCLAPR